jgi:hypothetical protein
MLDFASKVITTFKADVSDMRAGLKELTNDEKKLAQAQLDAAQQRNKGYDEWVAKLGNMNQALELGGKVVGFLGDAWKEYAEDVRLAAAAGSADIDRLRKASLGLRTEQELMEFAAKAQHGVIKANQEQMETAEKAMIALTRAGFDQKEVTDKVTSAMVSLKTRGLESLGVSVKEGKTDLETFNNLMSSLAAKASGVDESTLTAGESIQKMGVSMHDSIDNMKSSLGSLVQAMAPLLNTLARAVAIIADITDKIAKIPGMGGMNSGSIAGQISKEGAAESLRILRGGAKAATASTAPSLKQVGARDRWDDGGGAGLDEASFYSATNAAIGRIPKEAKAGKVDDSELKEAARERADLIFAEWQEANDIAAERMAAGVDAHTDVSNILKANMASGMFGIPESDELAAMIAERGKILDEEIARINAKRYEKYNEGKQQTFLESTFGKLEDINHYQRAFEAFGSAVGASYEAIVTGSGSAGAAFKKMLADSLMSIGKESAVQALKELAYAAGSAAYGNFPAAALHLKSAALHGAVAVAAGAAAHSIGTSSQVAAGDKAAAEKAREDKKAGGSAGGGSGGGEGSNSARPIQVFIGDYMNGDERRRRQVADEAIQRALRERDA